MKGRGRAVGVVERLLVPEDGVGVSHYVVGVFVVVFGHRLVQLLGGYIIQMPILIPLSIFLTIFVKLSFFCAEKALR